ncbi:TM2 domain-containing protein [Gryllotalpicola ginsengisoli]|uniref:TM2 domain-containing protein n=1 Tax=Gryllotalpicola ginsengisoli TaxID=444608 RepID=UPI0003B75472|nr:TM2 domain-containing protein [Gryllotalpicola ginsengisoli]
MSDELPQPTQPQIYPPVPPQPTTPLAPPVPPTPDDGYGYGYGAAPGGQQAPLPGASVPAKSFLATWLFALLLGCFGVDRFYLGKVGTGILKLITCGGAGIWYLVDLILVLAGKQRDKRGAPLAGLDHRPLRNTAWIVSAFVVLLLAVGGGSGAASGDDASAAKPAASHSAAPDCSQYLDATAQQECAAGDTAAADTAQDAANAKASCQSEYSDSAAEEKCEAGDTAAADSAQAEADKAEQAAAEAAEKALTVGTTYDNPNPAGTHSTMQSTNRLDGTEVDYEEWFDGYSDDWRGYDEFEAPSANMKYISFTVHVKGTDAGLDASTAAYDANFTDTSGTIYEQADVYGYDGEMPDVTLGAGQQTQGVVVFEVPNTVHGGVATFGDGSVFTALQ